MKTEIITLNKERNVTLTALLQDVRGEYGFDERPAMLVIPGGAYLMCSDREAEPIALAYAEAGYQTFVLRYTVGDVCVWPLPLEDYEAAMSLILENAGTWHVSKDRIAVVGFSAGGHLAACAATVAEHRPAAAVLVYPVILPEQKVLPTIMRDGNPPLPKPNEHVSETTCPCFFASACDDRTVPIRNTLIMAEALNEHGVPFESHIYSAGGHGFSLAVPHIFRGSACGRTGNWVQDSIGWLDEQLGTLTQDGFSC